MTWPDVRLSKRALMLAVMFVSFSAADAVAQDATATFHDLMDREWEARLVADPLFATSVGRVEFNNRLPDVSKPSQVRRLADAQRFLEELERIDVGALSPIDRINHAMLARELELRIDAIGFGDYEIPLNADSGFQTGFSRLASEMPFFTVRDYENYIARLRAFPSYVDQHIANMRAGLARGMTLPWVVLQGVDTTVRPHIVSDPSGSVFYAPFRNFPASVPQAQRERLREEGRRAIIEGAVEGYQRFLEFLETEYVPGSRRSLGASELPDGEAFYRHKIRDFTTLSLSPNEIHEIGVQEVARIRGEMDRVIEGVDFQGTFEEFLAFLRTDRRFYAETPEQLLKEAAYISKKMDGKLPALFKTLPRLPYGVEPVPDDLAPKYTSGRYVEAPLGSTLPGYYWVNTYKLEVRPLYNLEALSLHEAVPGHHLQVALNRELENLPEFRRFSYISAFGEGWGLYSEWLGLEAGFYTDPYSNFGRLTYEMWRACRLVVDTGLHAFGWTREQAMDYLAANTALPLHEIATETDRYISWPGQALAYKLGELKIKELRRFAEEELGRKFDIREFHDAVLLNGSVPLTVLEDAIERYVADNR